MARTLHDEVIQNVAFEIAAHLKRHGAPLATITDVTLVDSVVQFTATLTRSGASSSDSFVIHVFPSALAKKPHVSSSPIPG